MIIASATKLERFGNESRTASGFTLTNFEFSRKYHEKPEHLC